MMEEDRNELCFGDGLDEIQNNCQCYRSTFKGLVLYTTDTSIFGITGSY